MRCRIHAVRRDFGYPFRGRQNDVTGTPLGTRDVTPLEQRDVMTSSIRICAGKSSVSTPCTGSEAQEYISLKRVAPPKNSGALPWIAMRIRLCMAALIRQC